MINVFLLLGSNMGNRAFFLQSAVAEIKIQVGKVVKKSSIIETLAWGKTDEPDYLNQVLLVETLLPAPDVLHTILAIEKHLGRERKEKWGSRIIDIDILFYGNHIIDEPGLTVPHPQLHKRQFTLQPLAEIAPAYIHPLLHKSMAELNAELQT